MGYSARLDELFVREHGTYEWRNPRDAELDKLKRQSDAANYVLDAGEGKWYEASTDLAKWGSELGLEVRAEFTGEDGHCWRTYAWAGVAHDVLPTITWEEPVLG